MSTGTRAEEIASIRAQIEATLNEDPVNLQWTLEKVAQLAWTSGGLYAPLLGRLFDIHLEEEAARRFWDGLLKHRSTLEQMLGRPVGLRVAAMDHLVEINRRTSRPRLLEVVDSTRATGSEMIDPVTALHTRLFMMDTIPRETGRAHRFKINLSLIHMEIDGYAAMVEETGGTTGTQALREVAGIIQGCIRTIDYAARMSGAEFALLLTETDRMGAYHVAERIRQKVEEVSLELRVKGRPFALTVSAGVASFPEDATGPEELAARAREAYFTARARGVGRVAIYYRERREYIRLAVNNEDLQVTLIPEGDRSSTPATMRNISSGGVLFESDQAIELGRTVQILVRNAREADQVLIPGQVVRIEKFEADDGARYEIGVLFDLVVEEQLEGVIDFLERFTAEPSDEARPS